LKVIKEAKILHYNKQILTSHNKTKTAWNIVKTETGKKLRKEEVASLKINDELMHNQQVIANSFNDYFLNTAEKLMTAKQIDQLSQIKTGAPLRNKLQSCRQPYTNIKFRYTSTEEIERIIKSLKTKKSQGYDEIPIKILKWSAPFISSPLTYIFNKSIELGLFPSRLKYSTVRPIFKAGDKFNMSNFRPVSILTSFSKILENIIYTRIYAHVVLNEILANEQYGFRSGLSTDNASYTLIHEILSALNNKHTVGGIFCDLGKAFDCVNHRILLAKLEHYGIRGSLGTLIKSYLMGRFQRVAIMDKTNNINY